MKNLLFYFAALFSFAVCAQDCNPYVPNEVGNKWEITSYDKKGKEEGKTAYELLEKEVSGDDITFKIKITSYNDKGEGVYTNTSEAYCKDGQFQFDMSFFMDAGTMQSYQGMDVDVDATEFEIPDLEAPAGTTLKDGNLKVKISNAGMPMFNMQVDITDRKIEARESRETPAGKFDCIVLSQKVTTKMIMKIEANSKEWYAKNIGMVRSENYNKSGKLMGYSELTKIE